MPVFLEFWLGPVTSDQRHRIATFRQNVPDTAQAWIENRGRQNKFIAILKSQSVLRSLEETTFDLLVTSKKATSQTFLLAMKQKKSALIQTILSIAHMTTPECAP